MAGERNGGITAGRESVWTESEVEGREKQGGNIFEEIINLFLSLRFPRVGAWMKTFSTVLLNLDSREPHRFLSTQKPVPRRRLGALSLHSYVFYLSKLIFLFLYLSIFLFICIYLYLCLSVFIYLSISLFIHLSFYLKLSIFLSTVIFPLFLPATDIYSNPFPE